MDVLCDIYGKRIASIEKFHRRIHAGYKIQPFSCFLYKIFYMKKTIEGKQTHAGERPNVCVIYKKGFITKSTMDTHMKKRCVRVPIFQ